VLISSGVFQNSVRSQNSWWTGDF